MGDQEAFKKILKGSTIVFLGYAFATLLRLIISIILGRGLGVERYGIYSLAETIFLMFNEIALFGLVAITVILISNNRKNKKKIKNILKTNFIFVFIFSIFTSVILIISRNFLATFFKVPELSNILIYFILALPFSSLFFLLIGYFEGRLKMISKIFFQDFLYNLLLLFIFVIIFIFGLGLAHYAIGFFWSYFIIFIIIFSFVLKKNNFLKGKFEMKIIKISSLYGASLLINTILYFLLNKFNIFLITIMLSTTFVGGYTASFKFAQTISSFLMILIPIFLPITSRLAQQGKTKELVEIYKRSTKLLIITTIPLFLIIFSFSKYILKFIFGSDYSTFGLLLTLLSIAFFIEVSTGPIDRLLVAYKKTKWVMQNTLISVIVAIIIAFLLIFRLGVYGPAIGFICGIALQNILGLIRFYFWKKKILFFKEYLRLISMAFIYGIGLYLVSQYSFILGVLLFLLFLPIYIIILYSTKIINKEDIFIIEMLENRLKIKLNFIKNKLH